MSAPIYSLKIGGQAGQGIKSSGQLIAKVASRSGYHIHTYTEFPSLIRGGHNITQVLFSPDEIAAPLRQTDLLIALNQDTITRHLAELVSGSGLLFDADKKFRTAGAAPGVRLLPVPLAKLSGGQELLINTVAVGAALALLGGRLDTLNDLLRAEFADKGDAVIRPNLEAAAAGFDFAARNFAAQVEPRLTPLPDRPRQMIVNGAEAVALGAIAGGLQFAAIYPMSPISGILRVLAQYQAEYGYIYKQPEDEISAVNMAVGAGFAGARAMTATSGGGFCLMTEGYGLAGMTETPVVIVEGMRPGPATGLPTWSAQSDLQFILHAHQGDFPRIVLAASDIRDAFYLTRQAFNLAAKYQTPVVVIIDKDLCDDDHSYPVFDNSDFKLDRGKFTSDFNPGFARYYIESDGISTRSAPGTGNFFIANSDEHNQQGFSSEDISDVVSQQAKRLRKLDTCAQTDMPAPQLIGPPDAPLTLVSWGSNRGAVLHALRDFPDVNYLHLTWMSPFPTTAVTSQLSRARHIIDIESNATAQLAQLIAAQTGITITDHLLKFDGRPFFPDEISAKINSVLHPA